MWRRRSSPTSPGSAAAGYSLVEILVALTVGGAVILIAVAGYVFATKTWQAERQRLETQQNLRTAVDLLSREVRLAGACLPGSGPREIRLPILGLNAVGPGGLAADSITVRANVRCAIETVRAAVPRGATTIDLYTVTNFVPGMQAYILHQNSGEFIRVESVDQSASRLVLAAPLSQGYPVNSTVYGAEEQTFAIDSSGAIPVLTMTPSLGTAQPAVAGIERLDIRYILDRNCSPGPCDVVDLPANDEEWLRVRAVLVDIGARSARRIEGSGDGFYRLGQTFEVKPRNFLF
jgi:type II secretory pathway pseudopilin PulG